MDRSTDWSGLWGLVWAVGATNMPVQQKVVDPVRLMPAPSMKMAWAMTLPVHVRVFLAMRADAAEPCFVPVPSPVEHSHTESLRRVLRVKRAPKLSMMPRRNPEKFVRWKSKKNSEENS
jgi:hypothetical protein